MSAINPYRSLVNGTQHASVNNNPSLALREPELLKKPTIAGMQRDMLAHVDDLVGKSREAIEAILFRVVREHITFLLGFVLILPSL